MRISVIIAAVAVGILNGSLVMAERTSSLIAGPKSCLPRQKYLAVPQEGGDRQPRAVKSKQETVKSSPIASFLKMLVSKERVPWLVCTALSLVYFVLSSEKIALLDLIPTPKNAGDSHPWSPDTYMKGGFCVTGLTQTGTITKCNQMTGNSHQFAWGIDVLYALVAMALPFTGLCKTPLSGYLIGNAIVFAGGILGHGFLHKVFSEQSCNGQGNIGGYIFFIFGLMLVDLIGFSSIPAMENGILLVFVLSAVLTGVIYKATVTDTASPSISAFFMISQMIVSITGLVVPNPKKVTPQLGWSFVLPSLVSLVEFLGCDSFLVQYGGHVWYDFFLHLSMLVSLVFGIFN
jgi:hypothetical protein